VTVISPFGKVLRRWGKPGHGPGEFHFVPTDPSDPTSVTGRIAVGPTGIVYVSDSGNGRVEVFTPQGRFVRQFGSPGTGNGQFLSPFDLAVDSAGDVYVLDDGQVGVVQKFSATGKFLWRVGGAASSNPDLTGHLHLASIDPHGRLVMIDDNQGRVIYMDGDGRPVDAFDSNGGVFPAGDSGCDVTVDSAGNTYITGCGRGPQCTAAVCAGVVVFDLTHRPIAKFADPQVPVYISPRFGPHGEAFALGTDGSILKLKVTLPGA
jgi:sugar lactone lactonase YvrE